MISRRLYFSILLTMLAVSLLFMGTQIGREHWEQEELNRGEAETGLDSSSVWTAPAEGAAAGRNASGVVYIGSEKSPGADAYVQWARYAKRDLKFAASPEDRICSDAELLLVPGGEIAKNTDTIDALMEKGVNVLCLSLPPADEIRGDSRLKELLGISRIQETQIRLDGMQLFSGFLLGGERIYRPENRTEARERQDLPLDTPWYIVRIGTETYMRGILSEDDARNARTKGLKNEDMPAIIWRHHRGHAELFAVNGAFMSDTEIAGGIVQAVLSKVEPTSLYPVADAQVFSLVDFPALSDENSDELVPIYGQGMPGISRNIILPSMVFLPNRYDVAITAFAAPQFDYADGNEPDKDLTEYFRKELHSINGELALSLRPREGTDLQKSLESDSAAMQGGETDAPLSSAWAEPGDLEMAATAGKSRLKDLRTVVTLPEKGKAPFEYLSRDITVQRVTDDAVSHTYMQDLRLLCRETSMGYDSAYCDFGRIWQPRSDADHWQKVSDKVSSNLITYRRPFAAFDHVTASECDSKLRRYLMLDYDYKRNGDEIELSMPLLLTEASFVLRLNNETVTEIEGGTFTEIEKDAYLLRADSGYVRIRVAPSEPVKSLEE